MIVERYRDAELPVDERVEALLSVMTAEEKVAQLCTWWHTYFYMNDFEGALSRILSNGLGAIQWLIPGYEPERNVEVMNRIQRYAVENTRLGIPVLFDGEALAGGLFYGATYFPAALGLASTWEPQEIGRMCAQVRRQMVEYGVRLVFSPVLDIARDPRWGRIGETYGEDAYLTAQMGIAFVRAMQGDDLRDGVAATGKHFLAYGAGEGGINKNIVNIGPRELYEVYALPFEAVIREAGVKAIMNSYGVIDNVPIAASRKILTGLLKDRLGFDGVVFSDNYAIQQLVVRNRSAQNMEEAALRALHAGIDVDVSEPPVYLILNDALKRGQVAIEAIERSVRKVLRLKFELGLFEQPYARGQVKKLVYTEANRAQAYRMAVQSLVLLKNTANALPLSGTGQVAVIGPNADRLRCFFGGYSSVAMHELTTEAFRGETGQSRENTVQYGVYGDPDDEDSFAAHFYPDCISVVDALRAITLNSHEIRYVKGCEVTGEDRNGFAEAVRTAAQASVAVVVLGGTEGMGSGTTCGEGRDRRSLSLPGVQLPLLQAIYETGTSVILVVISSNPLDLSWAKDHVAAILQAWSPGQEAGRAIVDVLSGRAVPGGKLPLSLIADAGQIPFYYNRKPLFDDPEKPSAYVDGSYGCVYPFGHGLSYTNFAYSDLLLESRQIDSGGTLVFRFTLRNSGGCAGEEVVQVYLHDCAANVSRPVRQLVAFRRLRLESGAACRIRFEVPMELLAFHDMDMRYIVEPGDIELEIGSSSEDIRLNDRFTLVGAVRLIETRSMFSSHDEIEAWPGEALELGGTERRTECGR